MSSSKSSPVHHVTCTYTGLWLLTYLIIMCISQAYPRSVCPWRNEKEGRGAALYPMINYYNRWSQGAQSHKCTNTSPIHTVTKIQLAVKVWKLIPSYSLMRHKNHRESFNTSASCRVDETANNQFGVKVPKLGLGKAWSKFRYPFFSMVIGISLRKKYYPLRWFSLK